MGFIASWIMIRMEKYLMKISKILLEKRSLHLNFFILGKIT